MFKIGFSLLIGMLILSGCGGSGDGGGTPSSTGDSSNTSGSASASAHITKTSVTAGTNSFTLHATYTSPEYAGVSSISEASLASEMKVFAKLRSKVTAKSISDGYSMDVQCSYTLDVIASTNYYKLKCDDLNDDSDGVSDRTLKETDILTARWSEYGKTEYVAFGSVGDIISKTPTTDKGNDTVSDAPLTKSTTTIFQDTWYGDGIQNSSATWSIKVDFDKSTISYPSIPCEGTLTLLSETENKIEYKEHITSGICVDNGKVVIERNHSGNLDFTWYHSDGRLDGSGSLSTGITVKTSANAIIKKTGQTTSYANYDDGYYQKGASPRYTRASDIVTDELTNLMWQDDESAKTTRKTYAEAITYCSSLSFGGYTDWRLPSSTELESIIDYGSSNPAIDTNYFQNTYSYFYWSSSSYEGYSDGAWYVSFHRGHVNIERKSTNYYVRCVRGGQ